MTRGTYVVQAGLLVARIAVAIPVTLWYFPGTEIVAQDSQNAPSRATETDSESAGDKPTQSKSASDRSKGDTGVDIEGKLKTKKKEDRKPNFEIRSVRTCPSDTIT